jgi:hypothetical protein
MFHVLLCQQRPCEGKLNSLVRSTKYLTEVSHFIIDWNRAEGQKKKKRIMRE